MDRSNKEFSVLIKGEFHDTSTETYISRRASLFNPANIEFPGGNCVIGNDVIIRGDLCAVRVDRYSTVAQGTVLRPAFVTTPGFRPIPLHIGSCSSIGKNCVIESAVIGIGCNIGDNCILGKRTILRDFVTVLPDSTVPQDMVIPPFSVVSGHPAEIVSENPESMTTMVPFDAKERFKRMTSNH